MKQRFVFNALLTAAAFGAFGSFDAHAQVFISQTYNVNAAIPDGSLSGLEDSRTITTPATPILDVNVTLNISGTGGGMVNGDIYAYLTHDTGISILLNRPGLRSGSTIGYDDSGYSSVTFDDSAANDVHVYRLSLTGGHDNPILPYPSPLNGDTWQPDGRSINPTSIGATFDTAPRNARLDVFNGLNPNGEWTLFLADIQTGGTATLNSWTLNITAVPEPHHYALATGLSLFGLALWRNLRPRA